MENVSDMEIDEIIGLLDDLAQEIEIRTARIVWC